MNGRKPYTETEDSFIMEHYAETTDKEIAEKLGRSLKSVRKRAKKIGCPAKKTVRRWSEEEDNIILASTGKHLNEVAKELNRDPSDLSKRARKLGIKFWRRPYGDQYIDSHGYAVESFEKGKVIWVHRTVVEESIGRKLQGCETVHHINLNKLDNRIENLFLFSSPNEHIKCHWSLDKLTGKDELSQIDALRTGKVIFYRNEGVYKLSSQI